MSLGTVIETPSRGRPSSSLHFVVGEMNGKLDQLLTTILPQLTDMDKRVTSLEEWRWTSMGAIAIIVFVIGSIEVIRYVTVR
jgi:hypothetical protein